MGVELIRATLSGAGNNDDISRTRNKSSFMAGAEREAGRVDEALDTLSIFLNRDIK